MKETITKHFKLKRISNDETVLTRCARTETALERMVGLLGRKSLSPEEGLWIDRCNSIHTFFMRFPIDAVFVDKEGKILKIYENLNPWRLSLIHWKARAVLELAAGQSSAHRLQIGEVLQQCSLN